MMRVIFSFAKMVSCGQPYSELSSAMGRALALYLEVWGFDSGGVHCGTTLQCYPKHCHFDKKWPFDRHFVYYKEKFDMGPSSLAWVRLRTEGASATLISAVVSQIHVATWKGRRLMGWPSACRGGERVHSTATAPWPPTATVLSWRFGLQEREREIEIEIETENRAQKWNLCIFFKHLLPIKEIIAIICMQELLAIFWLYCVLCTAFWV